MISVRAVVGVAKLCHVPPITVQPFCEISCGDRQTPVFTEHPSHILGHVPPTTPQALMVISWGDKHRPSLVWQPAHASVISVVAIAIVFVDVVVVVLVLLAILVMFVVVAIDVLVSFSCAGSVGSTGKPLARLDNGDSVGFAVG